jgi:predicted AAA+ superfamily ATPase
MFPALIITGARQVGKTRLLAETLPDLPYVTLDDPIQFAAAGSDPLAFFDLNIPPVVVDEVQYAPSLFPYIKMIADRRREKGLFYLSGSQQFVLMKNVSESLAGRIGVLNLLGLSRREIEGSDCTLPFLPEEKYLTERKKTVPDKWKNNVWKAIQWGCFPALQDKKIDWELFYASYVKTYIERDVRQLVNIGDELTFLTFMTAVAARTGQLLNYASIAQETGVSLPTVERWISTLVASNIVFLLQPYHNNVLKRALKTPKVYFLDTGLACYLTGWNAPQTLERGAFGGAIFETYCIAEILKSYANAGREVKIFFYRDKEQNEIDLVIHENGFLYPLKIKKTATPRPDDVKAFRFLDNIPGVKRGKGGMICLYDQIAPLAEKTMVIPLGWI